MAHIKDIIGYEKQVRELERICDFLKNTDKYIIEAFVDNLKDKHYLLHSEIYKIYDAFVAEKKSDLKVG